jgi:predicted Zn-dependent peptidase
MLHVFNKVSSRMAAISVALDGGARSEGTKFSAGLAHMMEHMCFKGTTNRTWQEINRQVAFIGGHTNAYTSHEIVMYYIYVPVENIDKAMEIIADQVFNSTIPEEEFLKELEVVKQEEIGRSDSPTHPMYLELNRRLMPGRLAIPIIGTKESIAGFTQKEVLKYYKRIYRRSNAVVSLSANLGKREGKKLLTKHFGRSSKFKLSAPVYEAPAWESDHVIVERENLEHTYACVCAPGIDMYDDRDNALGLASHILGSGMDSRLFEEVREKRGLVYSISSGLSSQRETGNWIVSFQTDRSNVEEVIEVIGEELDRIASEKVTEEEFARAKNSIRSSTYSMQDSTMSMNQDGIKRAMFGEKSLEEDIEHFNNVTIQEVQDAVHDVLSDTRRLTLICQSPE